MILIRFLSKPRVQADLADRPRDRASWVPAAVITGFCAIYLLGLGVPPKQSGAFDLNLFGQLPVSYEGRTMPLDSLARNSLRIMSGYDEVRLDDGTRLPAINWLLDVFSSTDKAMSDKVFHIDHPGVLSLLGLKESWLRTSMFASLMGMDERERFTPAQVLTDENVTKLKAQYQLTVDVDPKKRDLYQRKILELVSQASLFNQLHGGGSLYLSPPLASTEWRQLGEVMKAVEDKKERDAGGESFVGMVQAYGENRPDDFHGIGVAYWNLLQQKMSDMAGKLELETIFNRTEPFIQCMVLYVMVFVLAAMSWLLKWRGALSRAALSLLVLTWIFHTAGLIARIYIQGRPPVTNLYSSAIFIAWAAVAFCIGLELIHRNGIACAAACALAFPSLLIAHYLAGSGDTMQMLQAVLDTNIWLATHVVVITLGYAATFLSGFLAIVYVLGGTLTTAISGDLRKTISRMIYGVVCFAMLFSFVGTILGGIWADQSWGRFWGWDPKENGAVLIVLWNAIILHARWGGLVRDRGMALLAVAGNIVTSWSWFGTNMLSFGLHSYGRMDAAVFWLSAWVALQVGIIVVGCLPLRLWRSLQEPPGFSPQPG
jgi:ABC-type transport system involved in cytochrome c biogenesis permease subunit